MDSTIPVGTVEEWTINNATAELHVFHIHQTDFQVTEVNGAAQDFVGHIDNVSVPFQADDGTPGQIKVLIDFRNPQIVGKFVYHCHILEHEDGGMMAIAEVTGPTLSATDSLLRIAPDSSSRFAASRVDRKAMANTLAAFQAGTFCEAPRPIRTEPAAKLASLIRVERLEVLPAQ